ncbi:lipase family protein [Polyangium mundeleinium]|uniref:Lipase family protein n=1 Tax=Polyangium mundeleinium TaxID=2995306 RepID=A0ABT5ET39_9BACT|nr:lipase family protein [Polyangium mundeleinium]MDC0744983.1 lipase family protein [Polyangium mundeleinium]
MSASDNAIHLPDGYDLTTAQVCSFLINVASDMCAQWIAAKKPAPADFKWKPHNACPVTRDLYKVEDVEFGELIWSTFKYGGSQTEPFCFVATYKGKKYLVFRGSQSGADFGMDGECKLTDYAAPTPPTSSGLQVEAGFYAVYNGLLESLKGELASLKGTLTVTGHSLGSALATLAVPLASSLGLSVQMYNQASPRVGNAAFAWYYKDLKITTYRLVNTADSVPKSPAGSYVHVGTEVDFTAVYDGKEANMHNACCSYSYAIFNPKAPINPNVDACMSG